MPPVHQYQKKIFQREKKKRKGSSHFAWRCFLRSPRRVARRSGKGSLCGGSPGASTPTTAAEGLLLLRWLPRRLRRAPPGIPPPASCSPRAGGRRRTDTTSPPLSLSISLASLITSSYRTQISSSLRSFSAVATPRRGARAKPRIRDQRLKRKPKTLGPGVMESRLWCLAWQFKMVCWSEISGRDRFCQPDSL